MATDYDYIIRKGNLGVGTANPSAKVEVVGSTLLSGSLTVTGSVTINDSDITSAWTSYTPVWTAAAINPSIGNGTITGNYKVIGKTCFVRGNLVIGSTSTLGTGEWYVSMPFDAVDYDTIQIAVSILDSGTAWYNALMNGARAGFVSKSAVQYQTVGGTTNSISTGNPIAWAPGDRFTWNGSYEIA
jgi:hypothetical protein